MKNSEIKSLPFVKFLIPVVFLYSSFAFMNYFYTDGIFLSLIHLLFASISGTYFILDSNISLSASKINFIKLIAISSLLLIIILALLYLTNSFAL